MKHIFGLFFLLPLLFLSCTLQNKTTETEPVTKKFPSDMTVSPSTFRCEGKIISVIDSEKISLLVSKMLQQGSSIFYSVSAGDTIDARFISSGEKSFQKNILVEVLIEERLKLNSEKPDFIIRQMKNLSHEN